MKKTLYTILLCGFALLALASCGIENGKSRTGRDVPPVATMKGVFYGSVQNSDTPVKLLPGKTGEAYAQVRAMENGVSDITLKVNLKVDPDGLAAYNSAHPDEQALMLPSSAYEFESNNLLLARYNTGSTFAKIALYGADDLELDKLYVLPVTVDKVEGTDLWELAEQPYGFVKVIKTVIGPEGGNGTMEFPYELRTVEDMCAIRARLKSNQKIYFKLMNDIDMSELPQEIVNPVNPEEKIAVNGAWTPLNYDGGYTKGIDFDGQGYTISNFFCDFPTYPSFFGVLNGYCHDVKFINAKVVTNLGKDQRCGILAGYCGLQDASKGIRGDCARVHVQGEMDHTGSTKYGAGGFFGFLGTGALYACSADVVVKSTLNNVGGLAGYCGKEVEIIDCWTSGTIIGNQRVGGIMGGTVGDDDPSIPIKIVNCYTTAKVYGAFGIGGIGGYFYMAKAAPQEVHPGNVFEKCIAWNEEIHALWNYKTQSFDSIVSGDVSHYSCGAIVGYTVSDNTFTDCKRNPAMEYNKNIFFDYSDAFSLYDQSNSSANQPIFFAEVAGANHNYPYHGQAAPEGMTVSQVAQSLGWSSAIWDFSGDLPTLRPDAQVGPVPDVTAGGQLPGFENNDL